MHTSGQEIAQAQAYNNAATGSFTKGACESDGAALNCHVI
jgi:hypothetical protein